MVVKKAVTKRKTRFKEGKHCPWCYDFDELVVEIGPISKERKTLFEGNVHMDILEFECPECGCTFDKTKGAE